MSTVPNEVLQFAWSLSRRGLARVRDDYFADAFGDRVIEYSDGEFAVRMSSDRGVWSVSVSDVVGKPDEWYDVAIVRDLLGVQGSESIPLREQIEVVEAMWDVIRVRFSLVHRDESHAKLDRLRKQRLDKLFPGFWQRPHA